MTVSEPVPIAFVRTGDVVREPVTKVGGQPVWLAEPQWPLSRSTGEPMEFLGQFALDDGRLAYLFMTDDEDDFIDGTYEPEAGENALVIQPEGRIPGFVRIDGRAVGPSAGTDHLPHPSPDDAGGCAGASDEGDEGAEIAEITEIAEIAEDDVKGDDDSRPLQFLGGPGIEPHWLQGEELPGEGWRLVVQLDSCDLPFDVNFGDAGVGYAFLSPDGREGRFLWQCC
ncbi:hypothetical protein ACIP2X_16785 [Streptomyces sp. NPDC089424]|uniref:hypothetical protein n=1 Tax=Streptomyces sp. NPDC089424 TaxID=3365917 RepID=UPI0038100E85